MVTLAMNKSLGSAGKSIYIINTCDKTTQVFFFKTVNHIAFAILSVYSQEQVKVHSTQRET